MLFEFLGIFLKMIGGLSKLWSIFWHYKHAGPYCHGDAKRDHNSDEIPFSLFVSQSTARDMRYEL